MDLVKLHMAVLYYDAKPLDVSDDGWVDVERIYCFDWDSFDRPLMERLRSIFSALPGSRNHDRDDCHWWFSDREDIEHGYLTGGVEPPGLQVFGTLPVASWEEWDREFQSRALGLPVRDLG
jgi:hypothetical protein